MTDVLAQARVFAVRALMAILLKVRPEKRDMLKQRIAAIKAGRLDSCPEVQSAALALQDSWPPDQVRGDEKRAS